MDVSATVVDLGFVGVGISTEGGRSAVEFAVSNSSAAVFLGPEGRTGLAILLSLLPGILCCIVVSLLMASMRWLRAREVCASRGLDDIVAQPLSRDSTMDSTMDSSIDSFPSKITDARAQPEGTGYNRSVMSPSSYSAGRSGAVVPSGLQMKTNYSVTKVGTDDRYRTLVVPGLAMSAGLHECAFTLGNSQHGRIRLGVVRFGFDPCLDPETNAHDTPEAWLYGEATLPYDSIAPRSRSCSSRARMRCAEVKTGMKYHDRRIEQWHGARGAETDDKIKMRLDLTNGELEVFLNRDSLGVMAEVSDCCPSFRCEPVRVIQASCRCL